MSDQKLGLPVRTEADADERLQTKIVDATTPSQQMEVDSDNNAHVESHGNNPSGSDTVLRLSELGAPNPDGDYDASNNSKPASSALIAHDRQATPADTDQNQRVTAVTNSDVHALDMALHDESGVPYSENNPLPVSIEESEGDEIQDFKQATTIAADASDDHTYSVASGRTLLLTGVYASSSSRSKCEVYIGDGGVSETFALKAVAFGTSSDPNMPIKFTTPIKVVGTANTTTVKITMTNRDNQSQDLYSTVMGLEKNS